MTIYPAIDIYDGKAVRLTEGNYARMTVYGEDPLSVARGFKSDGAEAIHVVDLQGARDGAPANFDIIKRIAMETGLFVQAGGGIRTAETIGRYLEAGIGRVILGTAAISSPGFLREAVGLHSDAIAVSADIKDGRIAIKGWMELSGLDIYEFIQQVEETGVRTLICTDVSKDGLLCGANIELYRALREKLHIGLIASGGISSLQELRELSAMGMDGAILGKALYEKNIDLRQALSE